MTALRVCMLSLAVLFAGCAAGEEVEETDPQGEQPACGDALCDPSESCSTCGEDCGECDESICGDGTCDVAGGECDSCPADCASVCG